MYVCTYLSIYVCMYKTLYIYAYICMYSMYICMNVCMYTCMAFMYWCILYRQYYSATGIISNMDIGLLLKFGSADDRISTALSNNYCCK